MKKPPKHHFSQRSTNSQPLLYLSECITKSNQLFDCKEPTPVFLTSMQHEAELKFVDGDVLEAFQCRVAKVLSFLPEAVWIYCPDQCDIIWSLGCDSLELGDVRLKSASLFLLRSYLKYAKLPKTLQV